MTTFIRTKNLKHLKNSPLSHPELSSYPSVLSSNVHFLSAENTEHHWRKQVGLLYAIICDVQTENRHMLTLTLALCFSMRVSCSCSSSLAWVTLCWETTWVTSSLAFSHCSSLSEIFWSICFLSSCICFTAFLLTNHTVKHTYGVNTHKCLKTQSMQW